MEIPHPNDVYWRDGVDPNQYFELAKETGKLAAWHFYFWDYGRGYEAWDSMSRLSLICSKNFSTDHLTLTTSNVGIAFAWLEPVKSHAYYTEQDVIQAQFRVGWRLLPRSVYLEAMLSKREDFNKLQSQIQSLIQANEEPNNDNRKPSQSLTSEAEDFQARNALDFDEIDVEPNSSETNFVNDLNPEVDLVKLLGSSKFDDDFEEQHTHGYEPQSGDIQNSDFWDGP